MFSSEHLIGTGRERAVYRDPKNPDRVIGFLHEYAHESPNMLKGRFYLTKIAHELIPGSIVMVHQADSTSQYLVTEYIASDPNEEISPDERWQMRQPIESLGIYPDQGPANYIRDRENSSIKYVETLVPWGRITVGEEKGEFYRSYNKEKLDRAIQDVQNPAKRTELEGLFYRLEELYSEEVHNALPL